MTEKVDIWKQRGNVYLWRYQEHYRNYAGWHISADSAGAASVLGLIADFKIATSTVYRTIALSEPTFEVLAVPNNKYGKARWWAPSRLRITYDPTPEADDLWSFPVERDPAMLTVGRQFLLKLEAGILDISRGKGDYLIGGGAKEKPDRRTCLWFWW